MPGEVQGEAVEILGRDFESVPAGESSVDRCEHAGSQTVELDPVGRVVLICIACKPHLVRIAHAAELRHPVEDRGVLVRVVHELWRTPGYSMYSAFTPKSRKRLCHARETSTGTTGS